jgi:hypothetical protein
MTTRASPDSRPPLDRRALAVLIGFVLVNGIAAGVYFHGPILRLFHLDERPALRPCPYHPDALDNGSGRCSICGRPLQREIAYWWDPSTTPPFVSDQPGQSPTGAALLPVYRDEIPTRPASDCGGD